jgi:hypothetical protein
MSLGPGDKGWEPHSLFKEYSPKGKLSTRSKRVGHSPTRTSRMRVNILKLNCYLNGEADRSKAAVVKLPEECDTLGEVLPMIHKRLDLNKRIAFAAELFLPDGTKISTYPELIDAAENDHAIIVTCGEAFEPTAVPYDLLEAYLHGGGRKALRSVTKELKGKQQQARIQQADTGRHRTRRDDGRYGRIARPLPRPPAPSLAPPSPPSPTTPWSSPYAPLAPAPHSLQVYK